MTRRSVFPLLSVMLLGLIAGCTQSTYESGYTFVPQPAVVDVVRSDVKGGVPPLTVLATVYGVRYADESRRLPRTVEVRLRFENNGTAPVHFDPNTLDLVTGSLRGFEHPDVVPPSVLEIAPGDRAAMTAYFPFPPDNAPLDMQNLRLRWQIKIGGEPVSQQAQFHRLERGGYYEPVDSSVAY